MSDAVRTAAVAAVQSQAETIAEAAEQAADRLSGPEGRLLSVGADPSRRSAVQDGVEPGPTALLTVVLGARARRNPALATEAVRS